MAHLTRLFNVFKLEAPVLQLSLRGLSSEAPKPPGAAETGEEEASAAAAPSIPAYTSAATPPDPSEPVGPGALKSGSYPNTEYYTYNKMSYFDLEAEMELHRIPQPSADNGQY